MTDGLVARVRRSDEGLVRVSERDLKLLSWIGEQYAVSLPQLARLMGRSFASARWLRSRWQKAGWVQGAALLVAQPVFVWLTHTGQAMTSGGFKLWRPNAARLAHIAAVNDIRLHIATRAPDAVWVCERQLARDQDRRLHLPDGVVLIDGEQHAIEVELVPKARARTQAIVAELLRRYDAAVYYCAPPALHQLEELQHRYGPALVVRPLPQSAELG